MATPAQEKYLDHIETLSIAICGCGAEVKKRDELQLVEYLMENGWTVGDKHLICPDCNGFNEEKS